MQNRNNSILSLREVPSRLLDRARWAAISSFATNETRALQLLNAPFLDGPYGQFWDTNPESEIARQRIHRQCRELCAEFRGLMRSGQLVAFGYAAGSPVRTRIPVDRDDLWPRFWTERIAGADIEFTRITVIEAAKMSNPRLDTLYAAGDFIQTQKIAGQALTKRFRGVVEGVFPSLKTKELDVLWAAVSGRKPGRPSENN
jgi:hypothetical protein